MLKMGKRDVVAMFRQRLGELVTRTGLSRAAFARQSGLDRSTLTQLLNENNVRLPRAETIVALSRPHDVSLDWLLGLTNEGRVTAQVMEQTAIEPDADEQLRNWQEEAANFKIRYVPTGIPDHIKTGMLSDGQEVEVCSSRQWLESYAKGHGIWRDHPAAERRELLNQAANFLRSNYPAYRWFLYDGNERYAIPYTIFGPKRVAIYVGGFYLVFTGRQHIAAMTGHFEDLIRNAIVQPHETSRFIEKLVKSVR